MKSRDLQRIWWDWLSTAERINRTLAEQTAALTLREVGRIESIQEDIASQSLVLNDIDKKAVAATQELAGELGVMPGLRSIVEALSPAEARQVESLAKRVEIVGANLKERLDRNRKLIESELTYVGGTLALIAKVAQEQQTSFAVAQVGAVLMDQVA